MSQKNPRKSNKIPKSTSKKIKPSKTSNKPTSRPKNHITTIKLTKDTKKRLDRLKEHERETYEQILKKILYILNISKKNPEKSVKLFKRLDQIIKKKEKYSQVYQDE